MSNSMNIQHYDCIIIGAGIIGTFHAYHAARNGLSVLLLEKDHRPSEATVRNFGQIVPSGMSSGKWQQYGIRSTEIYEALQLETELTVRKQGTVYFASDEIELQLAEELASINLENEYPSQLLTSQECIARYPSLKSSYCRGGLFFPTEINVDPGKMIYEVIDYLRKFYSVVYRSGTLIQKVLAEGDHAVVQSSNGFSAKGDKVIVCTGRDFLNLFPEVYLNAGIEVSKLQMMRTVPLTAFSLPGSILSGLSIRRYESFRECPSFESLNAAEIDPELAEAGIHILFKQLADGSVIIGDSHEYAGAREQSALGFKVDEHINSLILREAHKMFDLPSWQLAETWNGFYCQSTDSDIFNEEILPGIHVITAIGGKGMTAAPALAEDSINKIFNFYD